MSPIIIGDATIHHGDVRAVLATLASESVQTVVTSPPYWGLRDYGVEGQLGLEPTPEAFIETMVDVLREVRRVLRDDGTCWINIGDSYANDGKWGGSSGGKHVEALHGNSGIGRAKRSTGMKPKDLVGIPWMLAFALRADGWYLRQDIIWHKPNPMPESVRDRCTKAHEYIFLLTKSERYHYDAEAIKEQAVARGINEMDGGAQRNPNGSKANDGRNYSRSGNFERKPSSARGCPEDSISNVCGSVPWEGSTRNKRSVWTVASQPFSDAHFATFPPKLIEPCILAGAPAGGVVLDPFHGAGTTGMVALEHGRAYVGIELNADYIAMSVPRLEGAIAQGRLFA